MKKILTGLLTVTLSLMLCGITTLAGSDVDINMGDDVTEKEFLITELSGKYKTQGRTAMVQGLLMLDYSATGIEFIAECEGDVYITFSSSYLISGDDGGCYFTVIVDGVQQARDFCRITQTGEVKFKLAEGLSADFHRFEIYRQTEIERATVGVKSITLRGELMDSPEQNDLYVEFVGDSITTAYGNLTLGSTSPQNPAYPIHQDATQGYAYLTAKALKADWSIVARQGIGAVTGYQPVNMQTVYPLLRHAKDQSTTYDFARQPDYVVIGLGANDMSVYNNTTYNNPVLTKADVKQGFSDMYDLVRAKNPNAKIIWVYGWTSTSANAGELINEVIAQKGGETAGAYSLEVPLNNQGTNGHSYYTAHQQYAKLLSAFIDGIENPAPLFTPGNVDGDKDNNVNLQDVVALAQVVAGWDNVEHIEAALDVNGDGDVDLQDVVHLAQYVAGWDVELAGDPSDIDLNAGEIEK